MTLATTIQYTPFLEASFGYGNTELNTWFSNPTDIVTVTIDDFVNFNTASAHISTPSVGTAVSTFNSENTIWKVTGERDDVNQVLSQLKYFPQDYENARTWTQPPTRDNVISGQYGAAEEPPNIPNSSFVIRVYDVNNVLDGRQYNITVSANQIPYANQRPYWSVEPVTQDCSALGNPPHIDLGTISHGSDTENVHVFCEFRHWNSDDTFTGTGYGEFTDSNKFYIGDNKEATRDDTHRFNFTGSVIEAQAFLDNIGYKKPTSTNLFDMFLTISDGVAASTVTKTCYFSNAPFTVTTIADLEATEETNLNGFVVDSNFSITGSPEINSYYYTVQLDSTGIDGVTGITNGASFVNGLYTSPNFSNVSGVRNHMENIVISFRDDFNDDFTMTVQWHGLNASVGSAYSSSTQNVNVSMSNTFEISNAYATHGYTEDQRYTFSDGEGISNIAHGYNVEYTARITASDPNAIAVIWTGANGYVHNTDFFWENGNQLRMVGTRDQVNEMLNAAYFEPKTDYTGQFSFTYKQTRLGGDTTSNEADQDYYNVEIGLNNSISMTATTTHPEYEFTAPTIVWDEDISEIFDSNIVITDRSDLHEWQPSFGTDYIATIKMVDASGNNHDIGSIVKNVNTGGTVVATGLGTGSSPLILTGSKTGVNLALANLKFIPLVDDATPFYIQFKIERDFDSTVLADFDQARQIDFSSVNARNEYSITTPTIDWEEDVSKSFDSGLDITDRATENQDYPHYNTNYEVQIRSKYWDGVSDQPLTTATFTSTSHGSAIVSGDGTVANPLTITGTKADVNTALANLKMIPDVDWTDAPSTNGDFYLESKITRLHDSVVSLNYYPSIANFNAGQSLAPFTQSSVIDYDWEEDVSKSFASNVIIQDRATENPDYPHINGYYEITVRSKYNDGVNNHPLTTATFTSTNYGSATLSGDGTVASPLTITGTKEDLTLAMANLKMIPDVDWTDAPSPNGDFWLESKITRLHDSVVFTNYGLQTARFNAGTGHAEYETTNPVVDWDEDVTKVFNSGVTILDQSDENPDYPHYNTNYEVKLRTMYSDGTNDQPLTSVTLSTAQAGGATVSGTGTFASPLIISGLKTDVNTALENLKMIPYADFVASPQADGGFFIEAEIKRLHDSTVLLNYSNVVVFNDAENTHEERNPFNVPTYDWEEDTVKTFDSNIEITDLATENPDTSFYNTEYQVLIRAAYYDGANDQPLTTAIWGCSDHGSATLSGTGLISDPLTITGTKADVNTALANLTMTPDVDWLEAPSSNGNFWIETEITRLHDSIIIGGSFNSIAVNFNAGQNIEDASFNNVAKNWNQNETKVFDSGVSIGDRATENSVYPNYYNTTYTVQARLKYNDGTNLQPLTTAQLSSVNTSLLSSFSGDGSVTSPYTMTGTRENVETNLQSMKMIPDVDWTDSPQADGGFIIEYQVTRDYDGIVQLDFVNAQQTFNAGTPNVGYSYTSTTVDWNEDTLKTFDTNIEITDVSTENSDYTDYYQTTYSVRVKSDDVSGNPVGYFSQNVAGVTSSGNGENATPLIITGQKANVNIALSELLFTPFPSHTTSFNLTFEVVRDFDNEVIVTYNETILFNAATVVSDELVDTIGAMSYIEDTYDQPVFFGVPDVIIDLAPSIHNDITYDAILTISPSDAVMNLTGHTSSDTLTITGTKQEVNDAIRNITFTPTTPDFIDDITVTCKLVHYKNGVEIYSAKPDTTTIGTITVTNDTVEVIPSTVNQYIVLDSATPTVAGTVLSPREIHFTGEYQAPFVINDIWEAPNGSESQYQITFTVPSGITLYDNTNTLIANNVIPFANKPSIHTSISNGIRVQGATGNITIPYVVRRKTADNVEKDIYSNTMTMTLISEPPLVQFVDSTFNYYGVAGLVDWDLESTNNRNSRILSQNDTAYGSFVRTPTTSNQTIDIEAPIIIGVNNDDGYIGEQNGYPSNSVIATLTDDWGGRESSVFSETTTKHKEYYVSSFWTAAVETPASVTITTIWGTTVTYDLNFNFALTSPTSDSRNRQLVDPIYNQMSNYWDGTHMMIGDEYVDMDAIYGGNINLDDRFNDSNNYREDRYAIDFLNTGLNRGFTAFEENGDIKVKLVRRSQYDPTPPEFTVKSGYGTIVEDYHVSVQKVIADTPNNDLYMLVNLEDYTKTKHVILVKLNKSGSVYTWTLIKDIQLLATNEYHYTENHLSPDFTRIVSIQSSRPFNGIPQAGYAGSSRIRVYDKDQGGTNNWGLVTTTNRTEQLTYRLSGFSDVEYGDISWDGNTVFAGAIQFNKDQGGTNNWGFVADHRLNSNASDSFAKLNSFAKFTKDHLVIVDSLGFSNARQVMRVFDPVTYTSSSSMIRIAAGWVIDTFGVNSTGYGYPRLVEASKDHNMVGILINQGGYSDFYMMYQLTT